MQSHGARASGSPAEKVSAGFLGSPVAHLVLVFSPRKPQYGCGVPGGNYANSVAQKGNEGSKWVSETAAVFFVPLGNAQSCLQG